MELITANNIPGVALDFMNHDHQEATVLANSLYQLIETAREDRSALERISSELTALYQHNAEHFAREEAEMQRYGFPPYDCHKGEHERVLEEMRVVLGRWEAEQDLDQLHGYLVDTMLPWFINHIGTMDTVTAMFISNQK
ncbi:bacteriohemerythrin [Marinobacterium jannaschii]|uniref:bacteriohemerythrin n=1 Tax=Marinobacterium jannaschii TaxID=64970 RepID=UPI000486E7BE|nr:hemerythrin family protein [Marinobacterium jannaschii]